MRLNGTLGMSLIIAGALAGEPELIRQFGTPLNDYATAIATDGGAVFVAGIVGGPLPGQSHSGRLDSFLRKNDPNGTELWTRQFGTAPPGDTNAHAVAARDGAVYVAGLTQGTLPGQVSSGSEDAFLRRYDSDGNVIWTRQFGTGPLDAALAVAAGPDGIYVAGWTEGALPGQTSAGFVDAFLRKYDDHGTELWTAQFGTSAFDIATGVAVDASGVYVAGRTLGALPGQISAGAQDAYVRKYDLYGAELWTRQFGTSGEEDGRFRIAAASGAVYVTGGTTGVLGGSSAGGLDGFVRKFADNGDVLWTRQFGTPGVDAGEAVVITGDRVHVAGFVAGELANSGSLNAFVREYDSAGVEIATVQFGSAEIDEAVAAASDGNALFIAGFTRGALPGQSNIGMDDAFWARLAIAADTAPPSLDVSLSPAVLWPPNHKMAPITAIITAADDSDPQPRVQLLSVVSNEADDGDIRGVELGTDDRSFAVRAERSGRGEGRIYTVTYSATDASGNTTVAQSRIVVPHRNP